MFWGCVGGVLVAFWGCFGDVLGDALGMFWWCFGHVLVMFWGCIGDDNGDVLVHDLFRDPILGDRFGDDLVDPSLGMIW